VSVQVIDEINASKVPSGAERRLNRRFACDGFAEIFAFKSGFLFRGTIRDISQTGCYIATKFAMKLESLSEVDVLLRLKNHDYRVLARVRNFRPGKGVGLEFLYRDPQVDARFQNVLQKFLDKALPM